jgi:hypothetical protein
MTVRMKENEIFIKTFYWMVISECFLSFIVIKSQEYNMDK